MSRRESDIFDIPDEPHPEVLLPESKAAPKASKPKGRKPKEDGDSAPDQFVQMFQHATADPHSFMLCDFKTNEVRKNFDEVLKFTQTKSMPVTNGQPQAQEEAKVQVQV